jgi:hypothetical protein
MCFVKNIIWKPSKGGLLMEQIVQQMAIDFAKGFISHFLEKGIYELGAMTEDADEMAKAFSAKLLILVIEETDNALVLEKAERKVDGIAIHERDVERTQYTALGYLTFKRTYFDVPDGRAYILDELMNVLPYERVDTHVCASLVNTSGIISFGKSADIVTGGEVSRQTAWRKAMEIGEVASLPKRIEDTPERIHIFADEDHAHLQDGKNDILPLITICSGKKHVSKDRYELTDRVHINGYGLTPLQHWEYAYAVCEAMFDMKKVKEVYIYGDDAPWIAKSDECFPYAIHILDAQHYRQYMTGILAGEICSPFALRLYGAVKYDNKEVFVRLIDEIVSAVMSGMQEGKQRENKLEAIRKKSAYIISNWDAVQNMKREGSIGSCTEAMVSHVFSERFSRNPMGWSKAGLSKMSMLRVFIKNGDKITPLDIGADKLSSGERRIVIARVKKYESLVKEQQAKVFEGFLDWRCFDRERVTDIAPSGTKVLLDSLGRRRNDI